MKTSEELSTGDRLKINDSIVTVLIVQWPRALIKTENGSTICYNILGLKNSDILSPQNIGEQLKLL